MARMPREKRDFLRLTDLDPIRTRITNMSHQWQHLVMVPYREPLVSRLSSLASRL